MSNLPWKQLSITAGVYVSNSNYLVSNFFIISQIYLYLLLDKTNATVIKYSEWTLVSFNIERKSCY